MRNLAFVSFFLFAVSISAGAQSARHPFTFDDAASLQSAQPSRCRRTPKPFFTG